MDDQPKCFIYLTVEDRVLTSKELDVLSILNSYARTKGWQVDGVHINPAAPPPQLDWERVRERFTRGELDVILTWDWETNEVEPIT